MYSQVLLLKEEWNLGQIAEDFQIDFQQLLFGEKICPPPTKIDDRIDPTMQANESNSLTTNQSITH